ncbi:unnamed protein product, partial [Lymnaea stagnalis]
YCKLKPEAGPCDAYFVNYYYNPAAGYCQQFVYGGCGGNQNRFNSGSECNAACQINVV